MTLTPQEARTRLNESVEVRMLVQRAKKCSGSQQLFLDSEPSYRDPNNLGIVITETGRARLNAAGIAEPTEHFQGKTILVRGVVRQNDKGPYLAIDDAGQIEIVA